MSSDSDSEFLAAMQGVKKLKQDTKIYLQKGSSNTLANKLRRESIEREQKRQSNYLTLEDIEPLDPYAELSFKQDGVQDGVFKKLRLGKYPLETTIRIKNQKLETAHQLVYDSIFKAHQIGQRALLVQHGLDLERKPFSGFLKSYLNIWLHQMPEIIAFHSATARHGGLASTYVLLKKNQNQKEINREMHRAK